MNPGSLRHQLTLQAATRTEDEGGGRPRSWTDVATVWASVEPLEGVEALRGMQLSARVTHRIRMRYRKGVTARMRVKLGARVFEIRSVIDPEERHRELVLMAEETM